MAEQHKGLDYEAMQQMALQQRGHTHLLVIGVDAYTHCPPLSNCVRDAKGFAQLMQEQYQVSPECTYELYDAQATRKKVLRELKDLRNRVGEDDSLIIYFSGHGEIEDEEGYWIPVEGKPGEDDGWIAASSIKRRLNQIHSFHTLVIADACFAGSFFISYKNVTRQLLHSRRSRLGLSASHSRERALDGQAGENSPFAKELLRALRHNQQPLPVDQLFTQVRDAVAAATQGRQTPIFKNIDVKGDDQGQFVFVPAITEGQAWAACQKAGTVAAYEAFLAQFPDGRHHREAKEMLHFLKEESAWQTARQGNSIAAYLRYQDTYPQGRYFAQSVQAIADLEDAQDWATAQGRDTIAAYLQYQTRHPRGQYRAQAQQAVQRLREAMAAPTPKPEVKPKPIQPQVESKPPPPKPPPAKKDNKPPGSIPALEKENGYSRYRLWALLGLLLVIFLIIGLIKGWFTGSGGDDGYLGPDTTSTSSAKTGTVTLGGQSYRTIRLNGLTWMAENLNYDVGNGSWCYKKDPGNCRKYGRLYNWEAAKKACQAVGWRLPTDKEWREMAKQFGGADDDASDGGKAAYKALMEGGQSDFDARLGGIRYANGGSDYLEDYGRYWSATENEEKAWYYEFNREKESLARSVGDRSVARSCRCVQAAPSNGKAAPDRAPYQQPQIERSFRGDILTVSIQQGKRPYDLKLTRRGATVYQQKLNTSGDHRITITDYREDPGTYTIEVEDATGKEVERNVRIDAPKVPTSTSSAKTGTATLGGQTYRTVRLNGLTWMAENLNYDVGDGSWCYDNDASNCREHGRLYNWEAAKKACRAVGWRLPSDQEWREMAKQFGGADDDASDGGKAAYKALIEGGKSGFAAQLGGSRLSDGDFNHLGDYGFYWSATERDADDAWDYYFLRSSGELGRGSSYESVGLSCRCVQD